MSFSSFVITNVTEHMAFNSFAMMDGMPASFDITNQVPTQEDVDSMRAVSSTLEVSGPTSGV